VILRLTLWVIFLGLPLEKGEKGLIIFYILLRIFIFLFLPPGLDWFSAFPEVKF
jgi:hypothetical protein